MNCVSFFAGVGGIDLGFKLAGFKTIFANEFDKHAILTLQNNFKFEINNLDINKLPINSIPYFNIMLAGFPCQAFSIAGRVEGFDDVKGRGLLFFRLVEIFKIKKPDIIFLENVKNLISHDQGNTFKVIIEKLKKENYYIKYKILNSCEYGNIPQNRERIYIVCFKDKNIYDKFEFPDKIELTTEIKDCLISENLILPKYYYNERIPFFHLLQDSIKDANTLYQWRRKYVRENKKNLCPTLTANMGTGGHNVPLLNVLGKNNTIRKLTPRECFNFQGFPNNFKLPDIADCHLYKQAGNSVVVPVIRRIAENIKKAIS